MDKTEKKVDNFEDKLKQNIEKAIDYAKQRYNKQNETNLTAEYFESVVVDRFGQVYIDLPSLLKDYAEYQSELALKEKHQPYAILTPEDLKLAVPYYLQKIGYSHFFEKHPTLHSELGYTVIQCTEGEIRYAVEKFIKNLNKESGKRGRYIYRADKNRPFNSDVLESVVQYLEVVSEMTVDRLVSDAEITKLFKAKGAIEDLLENIK